MQVLLLGPYPPPSGGVQTNLAAIRRLLLERGVPCRVINLTRHRRENRDGVYYPKSALGVLALLVRLPASIIHLHIGGEVSPRLLALSLFLSLLPRARTVLTLHSGGYPQSLAARGRLARRLKAWVFARFDRIVAVNEELERMFVESFRVPADRVRLIRPHPALEQSPQAPLPPHIGAFVETHSPVLLSLGWLEPEYDYPLQIRALERLRGSCPRAGLLILGDGTLRDQLRAQIAASSCRDAVLLGGDQPHDVALALIARADVLLRTTHYDGDSISVREALHFGTPVVATDNGMRPAGVRLIPVGALDELVEAVLEELAKGRRPAARADKHVDNIAQIYELYCEIAAEGRP